MGIVMCGVPLLSLVLLTEKYITAAVTRYQLAGKWTNDSHVYRYILIYQEIVSISERWFVVTLVGNLSSHTFQVRFWVGKGQNMRGSETFKRC